MYLERLARTYWRFLTRVTLGLIRVRYTARERSVVLLFRPLKLLTFRGARIRDGRRSRGLVRWRIARGLLVAERGRDGGGYLQIEVRRLPARRRPRQQRARLHVEIEVANFYPAIASARPPGLRRDPVADPRDRHPRLPALARAPGPGRVPGGRFALEDADQAADEEPCGSR